MGPSSSGSATSDRPEAAMEAFMLKEPDAPDGKWIHEFTSLSTAPADRQPRAAKPRWHPGRTRVSKFRPMPGAQAPKPATSPALRLRQIRAIADEFAGRGQLRRQRGWTALRMLTTPIARYGKAGWVGRGWRPLRLRGGDRPRGPPLRRVPQSGRRRRPRAGTTPWPRWAAGRSRSSGRGSRPGSCPGGRPATRISPCSPINTGPERRRRSRGPR